MTDAIVFDTEPLVAYLDDEPGSDTVEEWIDRVASGEIEGYISPLASSHAYRRGNPRSGYSGCAFPRGSSTLSRDPSTVAIQL